MGRYGEIWPVHWLGGVRRLCSQPLRAAREAEVAAESRCIRRPNASVGRGRVALRRGVGESGNREGERSGTHTYTYTSLPTPPPHGGSLGQGPGLEAHRAGCVSSGPFPPPPPPSPRICVGGNLSGYLRQSPVLSRLRAQPPFRPSLPISPPYLSPPRAASLSPASCEPAAAPARQPGTRESAR